MKIKISFFITIIIITILLSACASSGTIGTKNKVVPDSCKIEGKTWELVRVETKSGASIKLDRKEMKRLNQENMFTLLISSNNISGRAAPNNYVAQIIAQDGNKIKFSLIASTRMAALVDMDNILLQEDEYFRLLQQTFAWGIKNKNLILHTINSANEKTKLIYSPRR
ncbi:MAG: META domain-containing protein [Spirochaetes bacterium]|nr:META domain-containing protein [Spirochaetota bacterium]